MSYINTNQYLKINLLVGVDLVGTVRLLATSQEFQAPLGQILREVNIALSLVCFMHVVIYRTEDEIVFLYGNGLSW